MRIEPLTAEHCMRLDNLAAVHGAFAMTPELAVDLEECGGWAALDGYDVLALAGILPLWRGTGQAWAWLSRDWRRHARAITGACLNGLEKSDFRRIETAVRCDFAAGHRWARRLGFEVETPRARKWGPDGLDYAIYVRLR